MENTNPIRILHILHSMNRGGAENAIMNYYRHIDRDKIQFDFLLTDQNHTLFEDEILSLGGRVFRVPLLTKVCPFPYLKGVWRFMKEHQEYKIVHSHTSSKSVFPLAIAYFCGIPVRCSHSHNASTESGINGMIRNALMPLLKLTATDYLACGEQAGIWLYGKKTFKKGKVLIFKNVIEADKFRFNMDVRKEYRHKFGLTDDTMVLGHTARFSYVKNHEFDIDILFALRKRGEKAKLLLVGGGEQEDAIRRRSLKMGVADDVIFVGIVPNVYDYEQAMDIFLLPSLYEGLPLSIIEAQVSGLPCFTTKGKVSPECSVTDLVSYLPLEFGGDAWAEQIIEANYKPRVDQYEQVVNAGYDATTAAKELQEFYMSKIQPKSSN